MKKFYMLLVVLVGVSGLTGCSKKSEVDPPADVVSDGGGLSGAIASLGESFKSRQDTAIQEMADSCNEGMTKLEESCREAMEKSGEISELLQTELDRVQQEYTELQNLTGNIRNELIALVIEKYAEVAGGYENVAKLAVEKAAANLDTRTLMRLVHQSDGEFNEECRKAYAEITSALAAL